MEEIINKLPDFKAIKKNGRYRAWLCSQDSVMFGGDTLLECLKKLYDSIN